MRHDNVYFSLPFFVSDAATVSVFVLISCGFKFKIGVDELAAASL